MSLDFFTTNFKLTTKSITPYIDDLIHVPIYKPLVKPKKNGKGFSDWCRRCLIKYKPFFRDFNYLDEGTYTD